MRKCMLAMLSIALLLMLPAGTLVGEEPAPGQVLDAKSGLEKLKTLAGKWTRAADDETSALSESENAEETDIRVTGAGSAVIFTFYPGQPAEMVSLFHMDGPDQLVHTHYCALGNQPIMRFEPSAEPNVLKFMFAGGTNLNPEKDLHVHNSTIRFVDGDRIEVTSEAYENGKLSHTNVSRLVRRN